MAWCGAAGTGPRGERGGRAGERRAGPEGAAGCRCAGEPRGGAVTAALPPQHFLQLEQIGGRLSASLLHCHDTETRATMTMALAGDVIAAGQDNSCHILRFSLQEPEAPGAAGKDGETPLHRHPVRGACPGAVLCFGDGPECPSRLPGMLWGGPKGVVEIRHSANDPVPTLELLCACPECPPLACLGCRGAGCGGLWGDLGMGHCLEPLPACPEPSLCLPWVPWRALGMRHCPGAPLCPPPPDALAKVWGAVGCFGAGVQLWTSHAHPGSSLCLPWVLEGRE